MPVADCLTASFVVCQANFEPHIVVCSTVGGPVRNWGFAGRGIDRRTAVKVVSRLETPDWQHVDQPCDVKGCILGTQRINACNLLATNSLAVEFGRKNK